MGKRLYGSVDNFGGANQLSYKALYYNSQFYVTTIFCQLFIYLFIYLENLHCE